MREDISLKHPHFDVISQLIETCYKIYDLGVVLSLAMCLALITTLFWHTVLNWRILRNLHILLLNANEY